MILCAFYLRVVFIKLSFISKIVRKCKGFEKSHKIKKEIRCGALVLKQTFQLLDQLPLWYKAVPTQHLQSVSSFLLPMTSHIDCSSCLKKWQTTVPIFILPFESQGCSCVHMLVFKSGDYFVQYVQRCGDNSRGVTNREWRLIEQIQ